MIINMILEGTSGVEIAQKYGFTDATVNYRVRRSTGMKPSELRRQHGWSGMRIPPTEVKKIVTMYSQPPNAGAHRPTLASVARQTGHTPETIKRVLEGQGVPIGGPGHRSFFSSEQKDEIAQLYQSGLTCPALAERFGVNEITIRRTLKMVGVPRRPRGRPPGKRQG